MVALINLFRIKREYCINSEQRVSHYSILRLKRLGFDVVIIVR